MANTFKFFTQIMTAKSALNALSDEIGPVELANIDEITYYFVFSAGTSAGAVQPETAHLTGYTGTWSPEGTAVTFGDNVVKHVSITGVSQVRRVRISTGLTGGTVTVFAMGR